MNPIVTIIVPCYNSEDTVTDTLKSIQDNGFNDFECIIVDDGSTDNSTEKVEAFIKTDERFRLIKAEHGGAGKARNIGIWNARGKYILPVDSDDRLLPAYLKDGIRFMEWGTEYSMFCMGNEKYINGKFSSDNLIGYTTYEDLLEYDRLPVTCIFRRDRAMEIGGFNEDLPAKEDYEFWIRYLYHNDKVMVYPNIGFQYWIRKGSRSSIARENQEEILKEIRQLNRNIFEEYGK